MDAKGSVDAATVDADEDSVPEKNNFSPRRTKYYVSVFQIVLASHQKYQDTLIAQNLNDYTYVIEAQVGFEAPQSKHALECSCIVPFLLSLLCSLILPC